MNVSERCLCSLSTEWQAAADRKIQERGKLSREVFIYWGFSDFLGRASQSVNSLQFRRPETRGTSLEE